MPGKASVTRHGQRFLETWVDYAILGSILLLSAWLHARLYPYAFDDAYIHFRIAAQFVEHGAPYYNLGQAVMASSSPAWTLLLTLLFWITTPSPGWVAALNALVLAAGALVYCTLAFELRGARLGRPICWSFALPYLAIVHPSSVGLMETPLAMLVVGLALWLQGRDRPAAFGFFTLASFLRPELALLLVLFAAARLGFDRRLALPRLAWIGIIALPLVAYQLYYFGTLIPHTMYAKSAVYSLSHATAFVLLMRQVLGFAPYLVGPPVLVAVSAAFLWLVSRSILAERSRKDGSRQDRLGLYLTGVAGALIGLSYILAQTLVFPWYVPLFLVPIVFALFVSSAGSSSKATLIALLIVVGLPSAWKLSESIVASAGRPEHFQYFEENARARQFLALGRQLHEQYPQARLMSSEIGGLGYGFDGEVLDAAGLLTPQALRHHPMRVPEQRAAGFIGAIPASLVAELRPEIIVGLDIFVEDLRGAEIMQEYHQTRTPIYRNSAGSSLQSSGLWWSRSVNVFIRRDLCKGAPEAPC